MRYCDHGSGIMVADPGGTLYYLNSQTLELIHATAAGNPLPGTDPERVPRRISCAADSPRAVIAYGGAFVTWDFPYMTYSGDGNGLVRLYDLTSGALLKEWNTTEPRYNFGDVAISPSGKQVAVSHVPGTPRSIPKSESSAPGPKHLQDLELFDVDTGKMTLQINAGHWPGRISFVGETQIASDDTRMAQPFYPQPRIKLWDLSNGKLLREFADPKFGARRFVAASRDGRVILGFIPKERLNGYEHNETVGQRLRLWDAATGTTIATSPRFSPHPDLQSAHKRWNEPVDPSMVLSDNGRAVVVYWKQGVFRIYVFSLPPAAPAQPQ